ncbi:MAG: UDP-N-acetylmuramoyl-L-alanyl-D-glutamate--2,6-diaminopimelate ligase [Candidatus Azambacteria bacterium]|nr:UDP-N-acetylmuramoyl-L-alanyl-D-glutamate--2,6-diaminopimelate ligase [Candidatus Azambacteria bacterium]
MSIKSKIKKIIPEKFISFYHFLLAFLAAFYFSFPSKKLVVVGITGTKGKTSAANFIWSVLSAGGYKTGLIGTANIKIGDAEMLNKYHMTMPGRFILQGLLKKMVAAGCKYCIVETTSEGIKQWRHYGIYYDIAVFTNLFPEHLQSHGGSFENYKKAKGEMFAVLAKNDHKIIDGKKIEKIIIANYDNSHKDYYLKFWADKKITYGIDGGDFMAEKIENTPQGLSFFVNENYFKINILGKFNVYNALSAIVVGSVLKISYDKIKEGLQNLKVIPGRMEKIDEGQNFLVFVDYAHEKEGMTAVLKTAQEMLETELLTFAKGKIIVLLGAEGGGRDKAKRPILGEIAAKNSDFMIVSNVDPYEDDPKEICEDIAEAAEKFGKIRNENLFVIEDRREGIKKAFSLANKNDIVLITGKGAEQSIVIGGKHYPWDDRVIVREELNKIIHR